MSHLSSPPFYSIYISILSREKFKMKMTLFSDSVRPSWLFFPDLLSISFSKSRLSGWGQYGQSPLTPLCPFGLDCVLLLLNPFWEFIRPAGNSVLTQSLSYCDLSSRWTHPPPAFLVVCFPNQAGNANFLAPGLWLSLLCLWPSCLTDKGADV